MISRVLLRVSAPLLDMEMASVVRTTSVSRVVADIVYPEFEVPNDRRERGVRVAVMRVYFSED
jgi:hypothetical protein